VIDVRPLTEFLENAGAGAGSYYLLLGRGRVLAALPMENASFAHTLSLYRPQRWAARLWVFLLKILGSWGGRGLVLRKWHWPGSTQPILIHPGVVLGNPDQATPRAIFLLRENHQWVVGKFVPDPNQQEILHREMKLLHAASQAGGHAPRSLGWHPCGSGGMLRTEWFPAVSSKPTLAQKIRILQDWLLELPFRALPDFPSGKRAAFAPSAGLNSFPKLRPALRHGDFAPWNLLKNKTGQWIAVDWEDGHPEDTPGLDLVHDFVQEEFLIRKSPFPAAKIRMLQTLKSQPAASYLQASGWAGHELLLLHWAMAYESQTRPEIQRWVSS
jgi:hypothetical protein